MKWFWIIIVLIGAGYYLYGTDSKPKKTVKNEVHEGKATLISKTRDHNALWIHYSYKDQAGGMHEMSEKVPYVDVWEALEEGKDIDIMYDNEGRSVLKTKLGPKLQVE
jgi:hypothetical protein